MREIKGELLFDNRDEALTHLKELKKYGITLYTCDQCGVSFGSLSPFITNHGIICLLCAQASNIHAHRYQDMTMEYDEDDREIFTDDELLKMI